MDCSLDSWERGRAEARENYAGALEVILKGAKRQSGFSEAGRGLVGAGDVVESATRRLEADCTVAVETDEAGSTAAVATESRKPMTVGSLLLRRLRYFTEGAVIGSKAFVERVFEGNRGKFPEGRNHASRPWRDPSDLEKRAEFGLHTLKDLRMDVYRE